jgi:hypothetical protein
MLERPLELALEVGHQFSGGEHDIPLKALAT